MIWMDDGEYFVLYQCQVDTYGFYRRTDPTRGFVCACGTKYCFSEFVYEHWRDDVVHVCNECGQRHFVLMGLVKALTVKPPSLKVRTYRERFTLRRPNRIEAVSLRVRGPSRETALAGPGNGARGLLVRRGG